MTGTLAPFVDEHAPAPQFRALDLTGALDVPEFLRDLAACDTDMQRDEAQSALLHLIQGIGEDLREKRFRLGDAAIAWLALEETRDRPTERGAALTNLAQQSGVEYGLLSECFAVARAFPFGPYRNQYPDCLWSWFVNLTRRTALPGERWGEERQERIGLLAAECAELGPSAARRHIEERLQKGLADQQDDDRTLTERYAAGDLDAPGRECYAGDRGLTPQTAGAPLPENLVLDQLVREVADLKARLDPQRASVELARDLWPELNEIGNRKDLEETICKSLTRRWGGVL